ncbi:hypothetical protein H8959_014179 [Pygathrix nigripes]
MDTIKVEEQRAMSDSLQGVPEWAMARTSGYSYGRVVLNIRASWDLVRMNSPEVSWVAQCRDSYPGCQPLKDTHAWASSLKMDPADLEGGPCDAPCDEPLIRAAWNLSGVVSYQEPAAGLQRPGEYGFCASDSGDQAERKNPC